MSQQQELIQILLQGQARKTVDDVIEWAGKSPVKFKILVEMITGNLDQPIKDRAAWAMSYIASDEPDLVKHHWNIFVKLLVDKKTSGPVKRNILRFTQVIKIPVGHQGPIVGRCFELINDPKEDIAIRAFAMTILANLLPQYPDMANELRISIEELLPHASPGLKNRANKILMMIEKL
jgi:hypothetical protein